jgi:hypothetical protein
VSPVKKQLLVLVKHERARDAAVRFFTLRGFKTIAVDRREINEGNELVISHDRALYGDEDLLSNTAGALVLDSGYMWPQPAVKPSQIEWLSHRNDFDEYLRNERECASLWYSLLEILNHTLPLCMNMQAAFEAEAFKPWALATLEQGGVDVAPTISGNDRERMRTFIEQSGGPVLSVPLGIECEPRWIHSIDEADLQLEVEPVMLQSLSNEETIRVVAVEGKALIVEPASCNDASIEYTVSAVHSLLKISFVELVFRYAGKPVLSDFSASPEMRLVSGEHSESILEEILSSLRRKR